MARPPEGRRRADIQGLRAVAVAVVIAYHVSGWPTGGFLGVDVFFVVSGFVITGVLLRAREEAGHISLRAFWARRARRILPLALIVIAAVVAVLPWAYAPAKAAGVRTDGLFAAVFSANWHFAAQPGGYFAQGFAPSPLLHYWSLGVEEQFYLAWPLLVVLALAVFARSRTALRGAIPTSPGRRAPATVAVLALVIGASSLTWAVLQSGSEATVAYYSTLTRAWELAAGCALATVPAAAVRLAPAARTVLSWVGLAVIAASVLIVTPQTGAPHPAALGACLGTLVVLAAGIGEPVRGSGLLSNRVSGYLGDISYGLYLWHFPLVILAPALLSTSPTVTRVAVLGLTLLLAMVSHHLVERPVLDAPRLHESERRGAWRGWWAAKRRGMLAAAVTLALVVAGIGGTASAQPDLFAGSSTPIYAGLDDAADETPPDVAAASEPDSAPTTPPASSTTSTPGPGTTPPASTPPTQPTQPSWSPIPLGSTGTRIQDGLRRALAATAWPSNLNPSPDQWQTTGNRRAEQRGCTATRASDPASCTFGNPRGPEIIVYGDSLGIPLLATVEQAYGKTHKIRGMTKLACAVNGVDADFGKDDWAIPCVNHREMVVDYVRKAKPAVLIMVENYAWALRLKSDAKGSASAREWLEADQAFIESVRQNVGKVVVLAPSMPGVAFADCYRPGGSPGRCTTGIPSWWKRTRDAEKKVQHATFVDTTHWYCVDGRCPLFTATTGTVLKGDYLHTSVQYARQLAPDLAYLLKQSGVLP